MKDRLRSAFQSHRRHRLGDPVRHGRDAECPRAPTQLTASSPVSERATVVCLLRIDRPGASTRPIGLSREEDRCLLFLLLFMQLTDLAAQPSQLVLIGAGQPAGSAAVIAAAKAHPIPDRLARQLELLGRSFRRPAARPRSTIWSRTPADTATVTSALVDPYRHPPSQAIRCPQDRVTPSRTARRELPSPG